MRVNAQSEQFRSRTFLWFVFFVSLNVLDTVLTNKAYAMLEEVGLDGKTVEMNIILQPLVGSWLLAIKGVFALVVMILADRIFKVPIRRTLTFACFVLVIICLWNARSIGLL
jgi:peptidoglycan/LPS O-acetylase OafA/YrhL